MDIESFSKISAKDWVWNFLRSPYSPTGNLENVRPLCIEPWSKQMNSKNDRQTTQVCWAGAPSPDPSWWLWSIETMACLASFEIIYKTILGPNRQHPKTTTKQWSDLWYCIALPNSMWQSSDCMIQVAWFRNCEFPKLDYKYQALKDLVYPCTPNYPNLLMTSKTKKNHTLIVWV